MGEAQREQAPPRVWREVGAEAGLDQALEERRAGAVDKKHADDPERELLLGFRDSRE